MRLLALFFLLSKIGLSQVSMTDNQWGEMYQMYELDQARQTGINLMEIGLRTCFLVKSPNVLAVVGYLGIASIGLGSYKFIIYHLEMRRIAKKFKRNRIILANE